MFGFVREKVSKNKIRFRDEQEKFDLDLTYITPRIIAMGFPSSDMEGFYRNPIGEVYRFFELRHKDNYKLYNLCAERDYDHTKFHGRVSRYPFEDHNAPPIDLIVQCCRDIHNWLGEDENNVVGINCKAGKGRTGLIICCYLMHSKVVIDSDEAMLYYGSRRTKDGKGVTIASQQRYVRYYNEVLRMGGDPPEPRLLKLMRVKIHTIPNFPGDPYIIIISKNQEVHRSKPTPVPKKSNTYELEIDYPIHGDVKIQMCAKKGRAHQKSCHFWFSTAFVPETNTIELFKREIDVANKDKKNAHFHADFKIEAFFEEIVVPKSPKPSDKKSKKPATSKSPKTSDRKPKKAESSSSSNAEPEVASSSNAASAVPAVVVATETKPKKVSIAPAVPVKESNPAEPAAEDTEFAQRRKRTQSFYDTDSEDEGLSSDEIEEKQMEDYFAASSDEEDVPSDTNGSAPVSPQTPKKTPKTEKKQKPVTVSVPPVAVEKVEVQVEVQVVEKEESSSELSEEAPVVEQTNGNHVQAPTTTPPAPVITPREAESSEESSSSSSLVVPTTVSSPSLKDKDRKKEEKKAAEARKKEEKASKKAEKKDKTKK